MTQTEQDYRTTYEVLALVMARGQAESGYEVVLRSELISLWNVLTPAERKGLLSPRCLDRGNSGTVDKDFQTPGTGAQKFFKRMRENRDAGIKRGFKAVRGVKAKGEKIRKRKP